MILTEKSDDAVPPPYTSLSAVNGVPVPSPQARPSTQMPGYVLGQPQSTHQTQNPFANLHTGHHPNMHIPLSQRPLDMFYVCFFLMHIPATLLLDLQAVYPSWLLPGWMRTLGQWYMQFTADPVVGSVNGYFGEEVQRSFTWLRLFMFTELFLQLPTFIYASYSLFSLSSSTPTSSPIPTLYPLLIAYGALTATTTLPCIEVLLGTPSTSVPLDFSSGVARVVSGKVREAIGHTVVNALPGSVASGAVAAPALTEWQRWLLLGSYIPFFLIPLGIAVDMYFRTRFLSKKGVWVLQKGFASKFD